MTDPSTVAANGSTATAYAERLRTPWWWYPFAAFVAALLGFEFLFAIDHWFGWVPLCVLIPAFLLVVWRFSSGRILLADGFLEAGDQRLAVADIDRAIVLSATELRRLVGRHSDPRAFVFIRSWVGPGLQLVLRAAARTDVATDPAIDPIEVEATRVPYWVISSRHPDQVLAALGLRP